MLIHVKQEAEQGTYVINFDGAERQASEEDVAYQLEVSSEFITRLTHPGNEMNLTPFLRVCQLAGNESVIELLDNLGRFLACRQADWQRLRRLNELWLRGRIGLIPNLAHKEFEIDAKIIVSSLDSLMLIHHLDIYFLMPIVESGSLLGYGSRVLKEISELPADGLVQLAKAFDLRRYEEKTFTQIDAFVDMFPKVFPAYNLTIIDPVKLDEQFFKDFGITSLTFEDVKSYYLEGVEVVKDLVDLVVALNNLKHRGDIEAMLQLPNSKVQTLTQFRRTSSRRMEYVRHGETFDGLFAPILDTPYRNAIGHRNWHFEPFTQVVTILESEYGPAGDTITLLQFVDLVRRLSGVVAQAWELVYHLSKLPLWARGEGLSAGLEEWLMSTPAPRPRQGDARNPKKKTKKRKNRCRR